MKKGIKGLLVLLLVLVISMPASVKGAGKVEIKLEIPKYHTVTIKTSGGSILMDGKKCEETVLIERQKVQDWTLKADRGNKLKVLYHNGEDVTDQVKDGVYTTPPMWENVVLDVTFVKDTTDPGGDEENPGGDEEKPGGDEEKPGGDEEKPGGDEENPGGDEEKPGGDEEKPGGDEEKPGGDEEKPGGDEEKPGDGDSQKDPSKNPESGDSGNNNGDNTKDQEKTSAKTGDASEIMMWILLAAVSMAGVIGGTARFRIKK